MKSTFAPTRLLEITTRSNRAKDLATLVLLSLATLLLLTSAPVSSAEVSGVAKYTGPEFRVRAVRMNADPKCEEIHGEARVPSQDRVVGENGVIENVFVYLKEAPAGYQATTPTEPVVLGQKGCMYTPRVLGIQVDQPLRIANEDPTLHNVRCLAKMNRPFNIGQPPNLKPRDKVFRTAEKAVKFKCDVHPWMSAFIFVMEHPFYAVSDASGQFALTGLPDGQHTFVAWHEAFGEQEVVAEVKDGMATLEFNFTE